MPEQDIFEGFKPIETRDFQKNRIIALNDGLLITDYKKVVAKIDLQNPLDYSTEISALSTHSDKKFKYFIQADSRTADGKSVLFASAKQKLKVLLKLNGETVVNSKEEATAILKIGYGISSQVTRTLTQGMVVWSEETKYNRFLVLAAEDPKVETNLWETRVESFGPSKDLQVIVPGLIVAAKSFLNKSTSATEKVKVSGLGIEMNIVRNPELFKPYIEANENVISNK